METGDKGEPGDQGKVGDKGAVGDKGPTGDSLVEAINKHSLALQSTRSFYKTMITASVLVSLFNAVLLVILLLVLSDIANVGKQIDDCVGANTHTACRAQQARDASPVVGSLNQFAACANLYGSVTVAEAPACKDVFATMDKVKQGAPFPGVSTTTTRGA